MDDECVSLKGKLAEHQRFWDGSNERPLFGVLFGGWSRFLENPGAVLLRGEGALAPEMLRAEAFVEDYRKLLQRYESLGDDLFHAAQPFPGMPWMEAMAGCPILRSEKHLWAGRNECLIESPGRIVFDERNPWIRKYCECLDALSEGLTPRYPVAQSVIRGSADVAAALLGDANLPLAMHDEPEKVHALLARIADLEEAFLKAQARRIPAFFGGSVTGQFEIWAPSWSVRLQDDAVSLLSPRLYEQFLAPIHERLCQLTPYNLFHLHTTSLHVLPQMLSLRTLRAIQVSRDEGVEGIDGLLASLEAIQCSGRSLVVKGRFSDAELSTLLDRLRPGGLCIQVVVDRIEDAERLVACAHN